MRKLICIVTVCFMIITMFSGCGLLQKLGLQEKDNDELAPVSSIVMGEDEAQRLSDKVPIHLYFLDQDGTKLKMEIRYIPVSEAKKSSSNLASVIVKELINGPTAGNGLKRSVPEGTKLLKPVSINAGVATVDLSKEFVDKHPGGKAAEQLTIYSIVNSLTEMKDIEKVKFMINGKPQAEYKGNFRFDAPFPRNTSLISKEPGVPSTGSVNTPGDSKKQEPAKSKPEDTKKPDTKQQDTKKQDPKKPDTKQPDTKQPDTKQPDTKNNNDKVKDGKAKPTSGEVSEAPADGEDDAEATYLENLE